MMKRNVIFIGLVAALLISLGSFSPVAAQDKMTFEEYQAELEGWQTREQAAATEITELEATIAGLRGEIEALEQQISSVWKEIYDMLSETEAELQTFADELDALASDVAAFGQLSPEEIYQRSAELDALKARLDGLNGHRAALLSQYKENVARLYSQIDAINARMAKPKVLQYTVVRGDYLWKIAAKKDHYSDGTKWMRIYSVNHDQINDPDLIYPGQQFSVPVDIDQNHQYLVNRGDHLYGIAESLFNDPFQWRKLYEANKELIEDPNYIVPEMILEVPGR